MKKNILLLFIAIVFTINTNGQLSTYLNNMNPEQNYYDIKFGMMHYLDSLRTTMDSAAFYAGDGEYKRFKIFEKIWEPKVSPHGDFSTFYNNLEDYYKYREGDYNYYTTEQWHELGPKTLQTSGSKGIGPVEFLTFYDNGTTDSTFIMLTGSTAGGLFYSTDTANTWHKTGTDGWHQSGCGWAEFHPSNHKIWFASSSGTGLSTESSWIGPTGGVFRTTDEGQTWELIGDKTDFDGQYNVIHKILLNRSNPSELFAATNYGLYKTNNSYADPELVTWDKVLDTLVYDIEKKPYSDSVFYVSKYDFNLTRWQIMVSEQYGNFGTWDTIVSQPNKLHNSNKDEQHITIEVSKAQPDYLYCVSRDTMHHVHYIDFATSNTWTLVGSHKIGFGDGHGFGVKQTGSGEMIYTSRSTVAKNYDLESGKSYITDVVHVDVEDIVCHPYNGDEVWQCTHGGVEKSVDTGVNMHAKYNGLGVAQVEGFASAYSNAKYVLSGLYHDGVQLTVDEYQPNWETDWKHCIYGDGMKPLINNLNPDTMWGAVQMGIWYYSTDAMQNRTSISDITKPTYFQSVGVLNKVNPNIFYHNKRFNTSGFDENVGRICKDMSLDDGRISNFKQFLPLNEMALVVMLYTPYDESDYLIANVVSWDTIHGSKTHHLFRTTNVNEADTSNVTWHELNIPTNNVWIADVEFDHNNPDIIYLAYSVNWYNQGKGMVYKIDYADLQNPVTVNLTKNLPVTSTSGNCLVNDRYDNGSLYLGTEYGVFFTDDNLMQQQGNEWQLFGTGLPHVDISGIDLNYPSNTIRVATFGRGHWELPIPCIHDTIPLTISTDTTWNTMMDIECNVEITSGNTLTINSQAHVRFSTESKLIVKPGGKLVVHGGTLTNKCYDLWAGIEVWGDPEATQIPANQGWLSISNGGTVENAVTGLRVGSEDFAGKGGGIVHTDSAFFRNNQTGVLYHDYAGSNIGNFNLTTFETTAELTGGSTPEDLLKLVHVKDITIKGCTFRNTRESTVAYSNRGKGITGYDATFLVDRFCTSNNTPCTQYQETEFSKLDYGIYAIATTTVPYADIRETVFTGNKRGVYLSGMTLPRVTSNTFEITRKDNVYVYGLYLDQCTEYWIEGNYFEGNCIPGFTPCDEIGIVVNESGYDPNEIYRNEFNNLGYSILAQGLNRNPRSFAGEGLVCKCNTFTGNGYDIVVTGESSPYGIAQHQGSLAAQPDAPAGNLFSWTGPEGTDTDINNQGFHISYYYHVDQNEPLEPKYYDTLKVNAVPNLDASWDSTSCVSYIDTTGGGNTEEDIRGLFAESSQETDSIAQLIQALEDAGDTQALEWTVDMSTPEQMWEVYDQLMNTAPYISDTVMEAAIEKEEVLPDVMLRDVMVASPESAKDDELLQKLEERNNPLPGYMLAQILQGRSLVSVYGDLLSKKSYHNSRKAFALNTLKRMYAYDTDNPVAQDSLLALLQHETEIHSQVQMAFLYLQQHDNTLALNTLAAVLANNNLSQEQSEALILLTEYVSTLAQMQGNFPDSTQTAWLLDAATAQTANNLAKVYARNLLLGMGWMDYSEPIHLPQNTKSTPLDAYHNAENDFPVPGRLEVYPNPATDHIIVKWALDNHHTTIKLQLTSVDGKRIFETFTSGYEGQKVITTETLSPGIYILNLQDGIKTIESIKVSIN